MGGTEKSGGETKILKRGEGANWVKGGGGCWNPLRNYALNFHTISSF